MLCNVTISFKIGFDAHYVNIDVFTTTLTLMYLRRY